MADNFILAQALQRRHHARRVLWGGHVPCGVAEKSEEKLSFAGARCIRNADEYFEQLLKKFWNLVRRGCTAIKLGKSLTVEFVAFSTTDYADYADFQRH